MQYIKNSFEPISNTDTIILILGTLPSDKSLEKGEYYGNPNNRFWKIISTITNNKLPNNYSDKKEFLLENNIGLWDIAKRANRKGSLDNDIINEEPNDLENFILNHKHLKVIGFNGKKSETLYDNYFKRNKGIKYISLPSSSSANTRIKFDDICKVWKQILT
jgi:hypoxanthine-DNA glycosylase